MTGRQFESGLVVHVERPIAEIVMGRFVFLGNYGSSRKRRSQVSNGPRIAKQVRARPSTRRGARQQKGENLNSAPFLDLRGLPEEIAHLSRCMGFDFARLPKRRHRRVLP